MLYEMISFIISIFVIVSYHTYLTVMKKHPREKSVYSVEMQAREQWVENMMQQSSQGILAVQTLRNAIMSAIFLASSSILPIVGILNLSMKEDSLGVSLAPSQLVDLFYSVGHLTPRDVIGIKLLALLIDFFWAFFCFCLAIGLYKQVGFLVNTGKNGVVVINKHYVAELLHRGEHYYNRGVRFCFFSVPLIFWMFGPDFMLAATIVLIYSLYRIDTLPKNLPEPILTSSDL
ncbi:MAG: DUF599 domain-containing protein [Magnetococcus sp. DMHC-6]